MSLLEERIKRSQKNRPMIKKPVNDTDAPVVRPGGRPNRVIPAPASQPSPVVRDTSGANDHPSQLKRFVILLKLIFLNIIIKIILL